MLVRQSDTPNANNSSADRESPRKARRKKRVAGGRQSDRLTGKTDDTCAVKADNTRNATRPSKTDDTCVVKADNTRNATRPTLSTKIPNARS